MNNFADLNLSPALATRPAAEQVCEAIAQVLGEQAQVAVQAGDVVVHVSADQYLAVMQTLKTAPACQFEQLIDLCGMDYSAWREAGDGGLRFGVVVHLLSISLNQRVRVKVRCPQDDWPVLPSVNSVWNSANWFEREAFDLFGIVFEGHEDLRRILTDYGFIGHPFRKDFPLSGHVEMRYDSERRRVVYEPVSIEPRETTPRIIREDHYGEGAR